MNTDGLAAKIGRADEALAILTREFQSLIDAGYRIDRTFDVPARTYRFVAFGEAAVPSRLAVIAGEVAHHLRSSLDHLVTQLASVGPGGGNPEVLEFPVCRSGDSFRRACERGKLQGLSDDAIKRIEALQPYNTSKPIDHATLYQLHDLDRIDKHRLLVAVVACVQMADRLEIHNNCDVDVVGMSPPPPIGVRPSAEGTEVFSVQFGNRFDPQVKIDGNFRFRIVFGQEGVLKNLEIVPILVQMRSVVATHIAELLPGLSI